MEDLRDNTSEVGEHEPYSTMTSEEIVSSGDEFDPAHYYDTSDIIITEPFPNDDNTGKIAVVESPQPHFAATDNILAVERPKRPAISAAASRTTSGSRIGTRHLSQLVDGPRPDSVPPHWCQKFT